MSGPFDLGGRFDLGSRAATGDQIRSGQYLAASALLRRLYGLDSPGAILADEVGLGKTYVALGVAAWLLAERPRARVLVLTNSRYMMDVWARRWTEIQFLAGQPRPDAVCARRFQEYRERAADDSVRFMVSSYETLKRFGLDDWARVRASIGTWLFRPRHRPGTRFGKATARTLKRAVGIDLRIRPTKLGRRIPAQEARRFWRDHFDWDRRCWIDGGAATAAIEDMELRWEATGGYSARTVPFDLVIVDEAHRLDAYRRQEAMRLLLQNRTRKILYVTATPFALDVGQLERLLGLFALANDCEGDAHEKAIKDLDLRGFERAVDAGKDYSRLSELERGLRQWIVRRSWAEESTVLRRQREEWAIRPTAVPATRPPWRWSGPSRTCCSRGSVHTSPVEEPACAHPGELHAAHSRRAPLAKRPAMQARGAGLRLGSSRTAATTRRRSTTRFRASPSTYSPVERSWSSRRGRRP